MQEKKKKLFNGQPSVPTAHAPVWLREGARSKSLS